MDGKKDSKLIFDTLMDAVKTWGLDMKKCVGFGYDGADSMVGKKSRVAAQLKKVNPFLTSTHCMVHCTNLVAFEASKNQSCKEMSTAIDSMLNTLAGLFKKSSKKNQPFKPSKMN